MNAIPTTAAFLTDQSDLHPGNDSINGMNDRVSLPDADFLARLDSSLSRTGTLEQFVRPLLDLLQAVTGMQSTYLTRIDETAGEQEVLFALNTSDDLTIPEKQVVPWDDTLCRRALLEGRLHIDDVQDCWGDSCFARQLGITSYASTPVRAADGALLGTLCSASARHTPLIEGSDHLLAMFARLISQFIEHENLIAQLHEAHEALRQSADTDALTGLPNRRALLQEIERRLAQHTVNGTDLVVSFVDLDGFKGINDRYGHVAGDRFLAAIADKLRKGQRPEDYCARLGGDEFVTLTSLGHVAEGDIEGQLRQRLAAATSGRFDLGDGLVIDYEGASIGLTRARGDTHAIALITRADSAMYRDKQRRRAGRSQSPD